MAAALIVRPEAAAEASDAALWYESKMAGLGARFFAALDLTMVSIAENPSRYPVYYHEIRRGHIRHFPYAIFFAVNEENVMVLAILHLHRDPRLLRGILRRR